MADLRGYVEGLIGFEEDGTNVVANPTGTPTDDLESIQIGETIYNVGGGGESIVPTPTNVDRGKYLGVKSNANELEYRSINELPSSEGASAGTVLTHTISGDSWLPPAQELPTYTSGDNGKVLGVSSGALAWVEQSGGSGVNYSTEEQDTGLTWIDGSRIYQRTFVFNNISGNTSDWENLIELPSTYNVIYREGSIKNISTGQENYIECPYFTIAHIGNYIKYYCSQISSWTMNGVLTLKYTKSA